VNDGPLDHETAADGERARRSATGGPAGETITMIWRRAALLAVVLLVLTVALVVALKLSHTATGPPAPTTTTR
jgi:hypothetical protein